MNRAVKRRTNDKKGSPGKNRVGCSLPPSVEGQLRCFLVVKIDYILWKVKNHPKSILVCLKWWGDQHKETEFWPSSKKSAARKCSNKRTMAFFPVCSGPRQFAAYLHDMGVLVLQVLQPKTCTPIGKVDVHDISKLSASSPIDRCYPVTSLSVQPVKFAELHVSLKFECSDIIDEAIKFETPVIDLISDTDARDSNPKEIDTGQMKNPSPVEKKSVIDVNKEKVVDGDGSDDDVISSLIKRSKLLRDSIMGSNYTNDYSDDDDNGKEYVTKKTNLSISTGSLLKEILDDEDIGAISDDDESPLVACEEIDEDISVYDSTNDLPSDVEDSLNDETLLQHLFYSNNLEFNKSEVAQESLPPAITKQMIDDNEQVEHKKTTPQEPDMVQPPKVVNTGNDLAIPRDHPPTTSNMPQPLVIPLKHENVSDHDFLTRFGINKLTALGRVTAAKVSINNLNLIEDMEHIANRTFFIEYEFPVSDTSKRGDMVENVAMETTRIATKRITSQNIILFNHHSVFPVFFDSIATAFWWKFVLKVKIFQRQSGQKAPTAIGIGSVDLKKVLTSHNLKYHEMVHIKELDKEKKLLGHLEVKINLMSNGRDLNYQEPEKDCIERDLDKPERTGTYLPRVESVDSIRIRQQSKPVEIGVIKEENQPSNVTLMTLLWVTDARNMMQNTFRVSVPGNTKRCNFYLISRMFWTNETSKSAICWGQNEPNFNFRQVSPVLLTSALLDRMHNNFITLEVWNKTGNMQDDELIGIIKLPLQQLYLSFKNKITTTALLKSKFPVIAVDGWMKITNLFKDCCQGELRILLAMGNESQVARLQDIKQFSVQDDDNYMPPRLNDNRSTALKSTHDKTQENQVEHSFEIVVQNVRKLFAFEKTLWGETDCFVQYKFPHKPTSDVETGDEFADDVPGLQNHRTSTILCIPDTSFNQTTRHCIVLPDTLPVQRFLLAAYHGSWSGITATASGITFELWKRHYYPNIRDQLVAKCVLPLAKLCGMVTMQRTGETSVQSFSLPLLMLNLDDSDKNLTHGGLLDVTIKYCQAKVRTRSPKLRTRKELSLKQNTQVCLSIQVLRASGLKAAFRRASKNDSSLTYASEVGGNVFVDIKLPFNLDVNKRKTRTIARTFTPEFGYRMEFVLPLILSDNPEDGEYSTLAQCLENEHVIFQLWHQRSSEVYDDLNVEEVVNGFIRRQFASTKDVMLGVVKIPLHQLLYSRTGVKGWFQIRNPPSRDCRIDQESPSCNDLLANVGALEIGIHFDNGNEREKVIDGGRAAGWSPSYLYEMEACEQSWLQDEHDIVVGNALSFEIYVEQIWLPKLLMRCVKKERGVKDYGDFACYVRYKFYDNKAVFSQSRPLKSRKEHEAVLCNLKHSHSFIVKTTSPFLWYMREERLEIQVWITLKLSGINKATFPNNRDKLIGSAYVDLFPFLANHNEHCEVSGLYPICRSTAIDMESAGIRARLTLQKPGKSKKTPRDIDEDIISSEPVSSIHDEDSIVMASSVDDNCINVKQDDKENSESDDGTIAVRVVIEQALHLPFLEVDPDKSVAPNTYVTYQPSLQSKSIKTKVIPSSTSPIWDHEKLVKLHPCDMAEILVMKMWHRRDLSGEDKMMSAKDICIGNTSVDLSPLASGLCQIMGWYNVVDHSGQCKGQIKIGVIPLLPLTSQPSPKTKEIPKYQRNANQNPKVDNIGEEIIRQQSIFNSTILPAVEILNSSKSFLMRQLRQNMNELDCIKDKLKQRLMHGEQDRDIVLAKANTESQLEHIVIHENSINENLKNDNNKAYNDCVVDECSDNNDDLDYPQDDDDHLNEDFVLDSNITGRYKIDAVDNLVESFATVSDMSEINNSSVIFDNHVENNKSAANVPPCNDNYDYEGSGGAHDNNEKDIPLETCDSGSLDSFFDCQITAKRLVNDATPHKINVTRSPSPILRRKNLSKLKDIFNEEIPNTETNFDDVNSRKETRTNIDDVQDDVHDDVHDGVQDDVHDDVQDDVHDDVQDDVQDFVQDDVCKEYYIDHDQDENCCKTNDFVTTEVDKPCFDIKLTKEQNKMGNGETCSDKVGVKSINTKYSSSFNEIGSDKVKLTVDPHNFMDTPAVHSAGSVFGMKEQGRAQPVVQERASLLSRMPNFFMPPRDLEQSMRSLRLAATFRKEPRQATDGLMCESRSDRENKEDMVSSRETNVVNNFKNWKQLEHVRTTRQAPLSVDETSRLAKIFSSTYLSDGK